MTPPLKEYVALNKHAGPYTYATERRQQSGREGIWWHELRILTCDYIQNEKEQVQYFKLMCDIFSIKIIY